MFIVNLVLTTPNAPNGKDEFLFCFCVVFAVFAVFVVRVVVNYFPVVHSLVAT